jgi:hypothetical protein
VLKERGEFGVTESTLLEEALLYTIGTAKALFSGRVFRAGRFLRSARRGYQRFIERE